MSQETKCGDCGDTGIAELNGAFCHCDAGADADALADNHDRPGCGDVMEGWSCTRAQGHVGKHAASAGKVEGVQHRWTVDDMTDDNMCPDGGHHVPDFTSISIDKDAAPGVVDINCVKCGLSGSTKIEEEDILW